MDYETIDWEAEAARVEAAFGIQVTLQSKDREVANGVRYSELSNYPLSPKAKVQLSLQYRSDGDRQFNIYIYGNDHAYTILGLDGDGTCWRFQTNSRSVTNLLVQGLSYLGLMTSQIEQYMKRSFTSNEELESLIANRPAMQFEPIDWEAEATRFIMAFDVEEKCQFVRSADEEKPYYYLCETGGEAGNESDEFVLLSNGQYRSFSLYPDAYYFFISREKKARRDCEFVGIHHDGTVMRNINTEPLYIVAEGVFNLGLYSPEVEVTFKGVYLQSSKQLWEAEHQARLAGERKNLAYDSMDWEAETKRIVAAFEMVEPCRFIRHAGTASCEATERMDDKNTSRILLKNGLRAAVSYSRTAKSFGISYDNRYYGVGFRWDGSHIKRNPPKQTKRAKPRPDIVYDTLGKALFFLDLFTPEVEEVIGGSITAHQKLEWQLEYEQCNGL